MRRTFLFAACVLLAMACGKKQQPEAEPAQHFTADVLLKTTPVKSQGKSDLCWAYAMLATIETEHLMQGDSVNLSPDYVAYMLLREKARNRYMREGESLATYGMMTMLPTLIYRYGCEPYETFHAKKDADYHSLTNVLTTVIDSHRQQRSGFERMIKDVDSHIEEVLGIAPRYVFMYSCEYTPQEFAHSVCRQDEYTPLTSFTHHPFGQRFELEVPHNRYRDTFLNMPIDSLQAVVDSTLRAGHPVCWEGDITEPGFNFSHGIAQLDDENEPVTQRQRQAQFERFQTTDDHCMAIIGIATDDQGKKYYICKNSWGKANPYHGLMYMSEPYFRLKTIAVMVHS